MKYLKINADASARDIIEDLAALHGGKLLQINPGTAFDDCNAEFSVRIDGDLVQFLEALSEALSGYEGSPQIGCTVTDYKNGVQI